VRGASPSCVRGGEPPGYPHGLGGLEQPPIVGDEGCESRSGLVGLHLRGGGMDGVEASPCRLGQLGCRCPDGAVDLEPDETADGGATPINACGADRRRSRAIPPRQAPMIGAGGAECGTGGGSAAVATMSPTLRGLTVVSPSGFRGRREWWNHVSLSAQNGQQWVAAVTLPQLPGGIRSTAHYRKEVTWTS
jgi:hypothetical protein